MVGTHVAYGEAAEAALIAEAAPLGGVPGLLDGGDGVGQGEGDAPADGREIEALEDLVHEGEELHGLAVGHKVGLAGDLRVEGEARLRGQDRGDEVVDIGEIAQLVAAAHAPSELAGGGLLEERREEALVVGAEDHVGADGAGGQAGQAVAGEDLSLGGDLGVGVGGLRDRGVGQGLVAALDVATLVYGAGGAHVDELRHALIAAGLEDLARAAVVDLPDEGLLVAARVDQGGVVDHRGGALDEGGDGARVADVRAHPSRARAIREIFRFAGEVQGQDLVAPVGEGRDQVAAHEARGAGDDGAPRPERRRRGWRGHEGSSRKAGRGSAGSRAHGAGRFPSRDSRVWA